MKTILMTLGCLVTLWTGAKAQKFSDLDKSPMDVTICRTESNETLARVIYSRPQKNNRQIFGNLVPFDKVWRTGANEATEITLYNKMTVGDQTVAPGTYSLFTIPGEKEWTIILNSEINAWGAYSYNEDKDHARIKVPVKKSAAPIEAFSMTFLQEENGAKLLMGWDEVYVEVPLIKV